MSVVLDRVCSIPTHTFKFMRHLVFKSVVSICVLALMGVGVLADESRVRSIWGGESLWGYWEFNDAYVPQRDWKIVSVRKEGDAVWKAANLIDEDAATFYQASGAEDYEVEIDLGASFELGAFTVLTTERPNKAVDSRMAGYEFFVSEEKDARGAAVASGAFDPEDGTETVVKFPAKRGRFVTLKATARATEKKEVCLRELRLVSAETLQRHEAAKTNALAAKKAAWEQRDGEAATAALGKEFTELLFCTPDEINRANIRSRSKIEAVGKLKAAGKHTEALRAFRDYFFDKLRRPQKFGLMANDVHPFGRGYAGMTDFPQGALDKDLDPDRLAKQMAAADALLKGELTLGNGTTVPIGEPGAVDWNAPAQPYGYSTKTHQNGPYRELWLGDGLRPLFTAYMATKDVRYLNRWIAYMDDWAMNCDVISSIHPASNHDNSLYPGVTTIRMFAGIAESLPYESEAVPPAAFARIMRKLVMESPLYWIVYMRSNGNGWTPGAGNMLFAMMVDEFKAAPVYFRETRRRNIEDINTLQALRDGTETHQWPGYNYLLLDNVGAIRLMQERAPVDNWSQPAWEKELHSVAWQQEENEALMRRASYVLHWGTPNGEYPLVTHHEPANEKRSKLREFGFNRFPQMLDDPVNARLYSTLYGDGAAGLPTYTAEWFPYGGYSIARDGWGKADGYGAMFCSPRPGCGGVGSGCKNNVFGLAAYGADLIADDLVHAYVRGTSPIQVDGKRQQFDFYGPKTTWPTAHRGDLTPGWTEPSPWRWHASERFNLMEGNYAGVYANNFQIRTDFVQDVAHQRLALYARKAGLWIITDRLASAGKHDYEQLWFLPLKKKETPGFAPEEIVVDAAARTLKTKRTTSTKWFSWDELRDITVSNVNLSIAQFTDAAVKYETKTMKSDERVDWQRLGVAWQGEGPQQVITALFPRKPTPEKPAPDGTENDLTSIVALPAARGVNGFEAVTPDGFRVTYLAAASGTAVLANQGMELNGEALLIVRSADAKDDITGIVLGGKQLKVKGAAVALASADFEFALEHGKMKSEPIYRPISPVQILPESDAFADEQEVTVKCETPGVQLTYTLDGTEPTPQSTPYRAPFKIDRTLTVKARAYRPGVAANPPQTSGTHATPTSSALFTKQLASLPEQHAPKTPGLACEYFEGDWRDLWLSLDKQTPLAKSAVPALFDISIIPAENPLLGTGTGPRRKTYALRYTGYISIPADGTYTIHAPYDYVHLEKVPGYELQVFLGHALRPDNNTTKRDSEPNYWYPATRLHGFGSWSVPLKKGLHEFRVNYVDFRTEAPQRMNKITGPPEVIWTGDKPDLRISGPGFPAQAIPAEWLWQ